MKSSKVYIIIIGNEFNFHRNGLWLCAFWWKCNLVSFYQLQETVHSSSCTNCVDIGIVWECCTSFCGVPCPRYAHNHQLLPIQPCCKWCYVTQQRSFPVHLDLLCSANWLFIVIISSFSKGYLCALNGLVLYLCYFTSVFLVILVTLERYLAICHPLTRRLVKGTTARVTAAAWIFALVMACVGLDVHETEKICIDWPDSDHYNGMASHFISCKFNTNCSWCWQTLAVLDFSQFTFAVTVCMFMYGRIIYILTVRSDGFQSEHDSDKQTTFMIFRARNQIAQMLILNGTVFFLCLAPFEVVNLDLFFYWWAGFILLDAEEKRCILWFGRIAMLLNSAINPILYNVSNGRYRNAFTEAFGYSKRAKLNNSRLKNTKKTSLQAHVQQ